MYNISFVNELQMGQKIGEIMNTLIFEQIISKQILNQVDKIKRYLLLILDAIQHRMTTIILIKIMMNPNSLFLININPDMIDSNIK